MLQNATPLRKSAPWPPNSSDEHVSCTAPATENAYLQILLMSHACHHFWTCYKTLTFCSLLTRCTIPCACHAKRHLNVKKCSEPLSFCTFDFEMCFAPQRRALFRHLNFQKWSEPGVLCTFWLGNVLRATTACIFDPPDPQIIGKTQRFATFLPFRAPGTSFFWGFFFFDLLSSSLLFPDSSHLCFSFIHIVGSLTSKLPSIIFIHINCIYIILHYIHYSHAPCSLTCSLTWWDHDGRKGSNSLQVCRIRPWPMTYSSRWTWVGQGNACGFGCHSDWDHGFWCFCSICIWLHTNGNVHAHIYTHTHIYNIRIYIYTLLIIHILYIN